MNPPTDQASRLRLMVEGSRPVTHDRALTPSESSSVAALDPMTIPARSAERSGSHRSARTAPVVTIASGKGGVGKTNLSVNLAITLAQQGLRVTLVDADLGMANADVLCGLAPARRLDRAVSTRESFRNLTIDAPGGFRLVPGSVGMAQLGDLPLRERSVLLDGLADLDATSDLILVDAAAGAGSGVLGFLHAADLAVIVTTPEPTAVTDAYSLIKCLVQSNPVAASALRARTKSDLGQPTADVRLVVNQSMNHPEAESVYRRIESVCARFLGVELGFLGSMCSDRAVPEAVRARRPFVLAKPDSDVSLSVARIAAQIVQTLELSVNVPPARRRGIGSVLSSWWGSAASDDHAGNTDALG